MPLSDKTQVEPQYLAYMLSTYVHTTSLADLDCKGIQKG